MRLLADVDRSSENHCRLTCENAQWAPGPHDAWTATNCELTGLVTVQNGRSTITRVRPRGP